VPGRSGGQEFSNIDAVVLALYSLGGDREPADTEDVAMRANELAPGRFTWSKYPDQVSLEHVRVFLSDAKKKKNGNRVEGDGTRGWHLTASGTSWAKKHRSRLASVLEERVRLDQQTKRRLRVELSRIRQLPAWEKFLDGRTVSRREAEAVFRLSDYVRGLRRRLLIDRTTSLLQDDEEFAPFIQTMAALAAGTQEDRND